MTPSIRASLHDLAGRRFDLLVVGGGITGAGVAREGALRGLDVALVEARDFGWGTSSRTSRLVHGGLRYLEQGRLPLVVESLRERAILLRLAPHLVRPLRFILPVFRGDRLPRWKVTVGLTLYDLWARGGNVPRHRTLGKRDLLVEEPLLRERGLTGGAAYYDAQCDDARLTLAVARAASAAGAMVANYTLVTGFLREGDQVRGASVTDQLTGGVAEIQARAVVNATGPWGDAVRRLEDPGAVPLLRPTKGVHIVVPRTRVGNRNAILFTSPLDGRVMFVLPWGDTTYVGTTDTDTTEAPDDLQVSENEIVYLLRSVNALFPSARLGPGDVQAAWAGLRPLLASDPTAPASQVSREHRIVRGPGGVFTVAGGKLTTFRRMAAEAVRGVLRALGEDRTDGGRSWTEPFPGGEAAATEGFRPEGLDLGLSEPTVNHLVSHYGSEAPALYALCRTRPELVRPLHPDHPAIRAEVVQAARRELACRVEDVLMRRLHLVYETPDRGLAAVDPAAELLAEELGWDEATRTREAAEGRRAIGNCGLRRLS